MRFLSVYKTTETGAPQSAEEMARMGKLVEEGMKAGFEQARPFLRVAGDGECELRQLFDAENRPQDRT